MFLGFTNTKINNNHKLLSLNHLSFLEWKHTPLFFWNKNPNSHPHCKVGEIQLWLIKTSSFCCLLVRDGYTLGDVEGEGIILGENPAEHCFVLRDLVPINFLKWLWNWKCAPQAKFLVKFGSKNYQRCLFSKYEVCHQDRDGVRHDACCLNQTSLEACSQNRLVMP